MKLYYIQNRGCCGNCMMFWRKGNNGYTCNLDEAETYTIEQARFATKRKIDRFWPKEYIDGLSKRHVDIQNVNFKESIDNPPRAEKK